MAINSGTYGPGGQALGAGQGWKGLSMDERTVYVEKYSPLIKYLADRLAARLPDHVAKEDLMSSGVLGLIDAVEKFEPDRGILFKTYAEFRIKGAMLDELRSLDWVPRAVRKKAAELEKLWRRLEAELGRPPSDEESAEAMGVELHAYHKALDEISVINMLDLEAFRIEGSGGGRESLDLYEVLQDENSQDALTVLGQEELRQVLAEAIDALPEKEKLVVTLYYHEELTMKEIGQVMGYTESRISQIHTKSVVRLRGRLSRYFEHRGRGVLKAGAAKETKGAKRGPKKREPQPAEPGPGAVAAPENAVPGPAASAAAGASAVVAASDAAGDSAGAGVSAGTGDSAGAGVSAGTGDSAGVAVSAGTAFQPVASHESPAPEPAVSGSPEGRWVSVGIPDEGAVPSADAVPPSSGPDAPQSGPGLEAALAAPEMSSASGLPGAEPFAPAAFAGGASPEGEVLSEPAAPADIAAGTDIASPAYIAVQADIASPTEAGEDAACSQSFEPPREPSSELPRETFSEPQPEQSPEPSADLSAASPVSADAAVPEDHAEAAVPASPSAETPETHAAADGPEVTDTGGALAAPGAAGAPDAENGPDDAERLGEGASVTAAASAPSATSQPFAGGFGGDGRDGGGA